MKPRMLWVYRIGSKPNKVAFPQGHVRPGASEENAELRGRMQNMECQAKEREASS